MGALPWDKEGDSRPVGPAAQPTPPDADFPPRDAIRSWLLRGVSPFGHERRSGVRRNTRRVLGDDPSSVGGWQGLASALQRHTLHDALIRLDPEERRIVTLAYLQGRTNRQIAATLGIPVSAVGRRLSAALDHLDAFVRRTGTWTAGILLLGLSYISLRAARLGQSIASADWPEKAAASVAAVAVAAVSLGLVTGDLHSASPPRATTSNGINLVVTPWNFTRDPRIVPVSSIPTESNAKVVAKNKTTTSAAPAAAINRGCHGRPTDVPTTGPDKPEGAVVHLPAGGCSR
jgi:sigma-70-like protein